MTAPAALPLSLRDRASNPTEIAVFEDWRHDETRPIHPTLVGHETYYDLQRSSFVLRQPYHDLREIVVAYTKDNPTSNIDVNKCKWQDVCNLARLAEIEYNHQDATSRTQWVRRKGVTLAHNLTPLKSLFPDEYGLSVVAGGLSLILNGVIKIVDNRDRIFQFFDQVPAVMSEAEKTYMALPRETTLDDHMAELRTSVTLGLCGLLRILQPGSKKTVLQRLNLSKNGMRALHNIAKVNSTAHQIEELQKAVDISKSKFDACVNQLQTRVLVDIHNKSSENLRESKEIRQAQHTNLLRLENSLGAMQLDFQDSRKQFAAMFDEAKEQLQAQNSYYILFQDALRRLSLLESSAGVDRAIMAPQPTMKVEELLSILDIDPKLPINDILDIGSLKSVLEVEVGRLAGGILQDEQFKAWLTDERSRVILIEELATSPPLGVYSATSVFSSMLATGLPRLVQSDQRSRCVTSFFCSLHSAANETNSGPKGMMRSMISQLIHSVPPEELNRFNTSFIKEDTRLTDLLRSHDIYALCHTFATLISQLSRNAMINCIIDEISDFEVSDNDWMNETCYVVQKLQQLCYQHQHQGPIFKLCMTSSSKTSEIYKCIPDHSCITPGSRLFGGSYITNATVMDDLVNM